MDEKCVIIIQFNIVLEGCSGYFCERAFNNRAGSFSNSSIDQDCRIITMSCGGCCGKAIHRKLLHLLKCLRTKESIEKEAVVVHFSSCIAFDNYHSTPCPHIEYMKTLVVNKLGLKLKMGTKISEM